MRVVEVSNVSKQYALGQQHVTALDNVSITVDEGEFLAIAGPSGSGKSTLLNLIGCIDRPNQGTIRIAGDDVTSWTHDALAKVRAERIGFIFQTFNLLPVLTAAENVEFPLLNRPDLSANDRVERIRYYLDVVGLGRFAHHRPDQMSGGQRQRVAIARALAGRPRIILADEPTANLDRETGLNVLVLMKKISRSEKATFIFSTHDPKVIAMASRIVRIADGRVIEPQFAPSPDHKRK